MASSVLRFPTKEPAPMPTPILSDPAETRAQSLRRLAEDKLWILATERNLSQGHLCSRAMVHVLEAWHFWDKCKLLIEHEVLPDWDTFAADLDRAEEHLWLAAEFYLQVNAGG